MSVEIRTRVSINQRIAQINGGIPVVIRSALEDMKKTSTPITPKKDGPLRANVKISVRRREGIIRWGQHYAWYQERGYTSGPVRRYTTPGTGKHFVKKSAAKMMKDYKKFFRRAKLSR